MNPGSTNLTKHWQKAGPRTCMLLRGPIGRSRLLIIGSIQCSRYRERLRSRQKYERGCPCSIFRSSCKLGTAAICWSPQLPPLCLRRLLGGSPFQVYFTYGFSTCRCLMTRVPLNLSGHFICWSDFFFRHSSKPGRWAIWFVSVCPVLTSCRTIHELAFGNSGNSEKLLAEVVGPPDPDLLGSVEWKETISNSSRSLGRSFPPTAVPGRDHLPGPPRWPCLCSEKETAGRERAAEGLGVAPAL